MDCVSYHSIWSDTTMSIPSRVVGYGKCTDVNNWEKLNRVGEGTYGVVYRAKDTRTGHIVALKKMRREVMARGVSESVLREVTLLKQLEHENIVRFLDIAVGRDVQTVFIVMEFCEQDLTTLIEHCAKPFTEAHIKCIMRQLLTALQFLHSRSVMHRDLKLSNLLLTSTGILKIADFGLARCFVSGRNDMTPCVVTLWYRCPEILFGSKEHSPSIDMWACGCILGELLLHRPLLPGKTEVEQIQKIIQLLGTPSAKFWPEMNELPLFKDFNLMEQPFNNVSVIFEGRTPATIQFLNDLFIYNPKYRLTAKNALEHAYFEEYPPACDPAVMPSFPQYRNR